MLVADLIASLWAFHEAEPGREQVVLVRLGTLHRAVHGVARGPGVIVLLTRALEPDEERPG